MVSISQVYRVDGVLRFCYAVPVLGLVGGGTPRVADSPAAGACRVFHNSIPPSKQHHLGNDREQCATLTCTLVS